MGGRSWPPAPRPIVDIIVRKSISACAWLAWFIPWPIWALLTLAGGAIGMLTPTRHIVFANIAHAFPENTPTGWRAWWIGCRQISTHLDTVVLLLRSGTTRSQRRGGLSVRNPEHAIPHLGKRGIVIVSPHAGPYPSLGFRAHPWLREHGFTGEVVVVARLFRPFRSGALMDWFVSVFARAGTTIIPVDTPPRTLAIRLRRTLANNGLVVLLIDEPTAYRSVLVPFFDDAIEMPEGPVRLAHATGSVLLPVVARYERFRAMSATIGRAVEPEADPARTLARVAKELEPMIRDNLPQWTMLTPIWQSSRTATTSETGAATPSTSTRPQAADGDYPHGVADLHLHTPGSDGLVTIDEWRDEADRRGIDVIAITDHDHIATIRDWIRAERARPADEPRHPVEVIPGVELTARGRAIHVGVLFTEDIPDALPRPGTRLPNVIRWARSIPGTIVILVHPTPLIWERQLRGLARQGLLPDAIETRFPMVGSKIAPLEQAAREFGIASLGASDGHLHPSYLGRNLTGFPGHSAADLIAAIRSRTTWSLQPDRPIAIPRSVSLYQSGSSWLLPLRWIPGVSAANRALLRRARRAAGLGDFPPGAPTSS